MQSSYSLGSSKSFIWKERLRNQAKVTQDDLIYGANFPRGRITGTFLYLSFFCLQSGPESPRTKVRTGLLCLSFAAGHHGPSCVRSIAVIIPWSMKLVNVMNCVSIPCHWNVFFQYHWICQRWLVCSMTDISQQRKQSNKDKAHNTLILPHLYSLSPCHCSEPITFIHHLGTNRMGKSILLFPPVSPWQDFYVALLRELNVRSGF